MCICVLVYVLNTMPKRNAIPTVAYTVRLTAADKAWLEATSAKTHVPVPTILVWAIDALRQYAQAHNGTIPTPVDIQVLWKLAQEIDPRRTRYEGLVREEPTSEDENLWRKPGDHDVDRDTSR